MLRTMDSDGASSALTAAWTTVETAYNGGENPYSNGCYLARSPKKCCSLKQHSTWGTTRGIRAPSVSALVGTILRTSHHKRQLYVISKGEYMANKNDARRPVGTRTPSANKPTVTAAPVLVTFSKRKRDQGDKDKAS